MDMSTRWNNLLSDALNIPISDKLYPYFAHYQEYCHVLLDEADNADFIVYCKDKYLPFYMHRERDSKEILGIASTPILYDIIKKNFSDIKELCIAPKISTRRIPNSDIKRHYVSIKDKDCGITVVELKSETIPFDVYSLFTCSYGIHNRSVTDYVFVPDLNTYNKLILMLGGNTDFLLYHITKK